MARDLPGDVSRISCCFEITPVVPTNFGSEIPVVIPIVCSILIDIEIEDVVVDVVPVAIHQVDSGYQVSDEGVICNVAS